MNGWNVILNDEEDAFFETKVRNGWIEYAIEIIGTGKAKKYGVGFNMLYQRFAYSNTYVDLVKKYPELLRVIYSDAKERILARVKQSKSCA